MTRRPYEVTVHLSAEVRITTRIDADSPLDAEEGVDLHGFAPFTATPDTHAALLALLGRPGACTVTWADVQDRYTLITAQETPCS